MSEPILEVEGLSVSYPDGFCLRPVSFTLGRGEILSVTGESGSGKSTLAKAVVNLFTCRYAKITGSVRISGQEILAMDSGMLRERRMRDFSIVFQDAKGSLNPSMRLRTQLEEVLSKQFPRSEWKSRSARLMQQVGLCEADLERYPRELSGGMAQRFLIAQAVALSPPLVVLDEPTAALDVQARAGLIELVRKMNREEKTAFLVITHDLLLARELSGRMMVLYKGVVEESGPVAEVLETPCHPYTRGLIASSPDLYPFRDLWGIRAGEGQAGGCPFLGRCTQPGPDCGQGIPALRPVSPTRMLACWRGGIVTMLEGKGIDKAYGRQAVLRQAAILVRSGETVALVGPSGSGKSTLAAILSGYLKADRGEVRFEGMPADFIKLRRTPGGIQMVFQDSEDALDPNFTVIQAVEEPLALTRQENVREKALQAVRQAGLGNTEGLLQQKISSLSGGQKQRVNLARALAMRPRVLVADEPFSMLDVSSKANLLRTLKQLQNENGFSMLLITHDIAAAKKVADQVWLLENGAPHRIPQAVGTAAQPGARRAEKQDGGALG